MIYHVSIDGCDLAEGTASAPFKTINRAAQAAVSGDVVKVHSGVYREWVDPIHGGRSDFERIVYEAAEGEHPVIKGSEIVTGWEKIEKTTVWKKTLPNTMFGDWNPYALIVGGDWLMNPLGGERRGVKSDDGYFVHLGEVYINGVSIYEATSEEDLYSDGVRYVGCNSYWGFDDGSIQYPERTIYRWRAEVDGETTTIYVNFRELDPNTETVEINVRPCCFYPKKSGVDFITLRGFEIAQAACPWTPPTSDQIGMVGPHWSRGWIIENNDIHDAKCSAVSLGKESSTGHNMHTKFGRKSGHRYQLEAVFMGIKLGWSKEKTGSHIVRNNTIHDCGQNGVVGHMGAAFSRVEHNHIYNIGLKREFFGHEMGGIKLHAGIDVIIENNNIHHCTLGAWLDWQDQGARITRNIFYHNIRDLMVEVSHGPCLIDNNILMSRYAMDNWAQGTAMVHNLILGNVCQKQVLNRATQYHFHHSTEVAGYAEIYGGDDRIYNNMFLGKWEPGEADLESFGAVYDKYSSPEEYEYIFETSETRGINFYHTTPQPVWIADNLYSGYAVCARFETGAVKAVGIDAEIEECDGKVVLKLVIPEGIKIPEVKEVTTGKLGMPRISECPFDTPDGHPVDVKKDICGNTREDFIPGPFAKLKTGKQSFVVWEA